MASMCERSKNITIIGDIAIEMRTSISISFQELNAHSIINSDINFSIGGSGGHLAQFAASQFDKITVLCKTGNDILGQVANSLLDEYKINLPYKSSKLKTCVIVICYDRKGTGSRLLLKNSPNACHDLTLRDIDMQKSAICSSTILYVSGYHLFYGPPRSEATSAAIRMASLKNIPIVIDIVPHDIYLTMTLSDLLDMYGLSNMWICEVSTIRRFLNLGDKKEVITKNIVIETVSKLQNIGGIWLLRFGQYNYEHQLLLTPERELWMDTNYIQGKTNPAGYGEKLAIEAIKILLEKEWK